MIDMEVYESDFGNFKMYVSDFKVGAPGYIWDEIEGWCKTKVTYVKFYDAPISEQCKDSSDIFRHEGTGAGEFITDDFCCWICMESKEDEIPEDEVNIKVIGYC